MPCHLSIVLNLILRLILRQPRPMFISRRAARPPTCRRRRLVARHHRIQFLLLIALEFCRVLIGSSRPRQSFSHRRLRCTEVALTGLAILRNFHRFTLGSCHRRRIILNRNPDQQPRCNCSRWRNPSQICFSLGYLRYRFPLRGGSIRSRCRLCGERRRLYRS